MKVERKKKNYYAILLFYKYKMFANNIYTRRRREKCPKSLFACETRWLTIMQNLFPFFSYIITTHCSTKKETIP